MLFKPFDNRRKVRRQERGFRGSQTPGPSPRRRSFRVHLNVALRSISTWSEGQFTPRFDVLKIARADLDPLGNELLSKPGTVSQLDDVSGQLSFIGFGEASDGHFPRVLRIGKTENTRLLLASWGRHDFPIRPKVNVRI